MNDARSDSGSASEALRVHLEATGEMGKAAKGAVMELLGRLYDANEKVKETQRLAEEASKASLKKNESLKPGDPGVVRKNFPPDVPVRTDPVEPVKILDLSKASSASPVSADPVSPPPDSTATAQPPSGGRERGKKQSATATAAATAGKSGNTRYQEALFNEINTALKGIETTLGLMHTGVSRKLDDIEKANDKYYRVSEKLQTSLLEEIQKITKSVGGVEKSLKEDVLKKVEDDREGDKGKGKGKIPRPTSAPKRRRKGSRTLLGDLMSLGGFFAGVLGTVLKKFWGMALKGIIGGIKDIFERVLPVVFNRLIPSLVKGMGAFLQTTAGKLLGGAAIGLGVEELAKYGFEKATGVDPRNMQGGDNLATAAGGQVATHLAGIGAALAILGPAGAIGAAILMIALDTKRIIEIGQDIAKDSRDSEKNREDFYRINRLNTQKLTDKINSDETLSEAEKVAQSSLIEAQQIPIPNIGDRYTLTSEDDRLKDRIAKGVVDKDAIKMDRDWWTEKLNSVTYEQTPENLKRDVHFKQERIREAEDHLKRLKAAKLRAEQSPQLDPTKVASTPDRSVKQASTVIQQGVQNDQKTRSATLAMANVGNVNTVNNVNTSETGILASAFSFRAEEKRIPPMLARG
jgi:hypothetical protein